MIPAPKYGMQSMGSQDLPRARLTAPYEKYTYAMLRSECYARSLSISGKSSITTKAGFIQLLYEYDKASSQHQNQNFQQNWKQHETMALPAPVRPPNLKFHQQASAMQNQVIVPGNVQRAETNTKQTRAKRGCRFRLINVLLTPTFATRWRDLRYEHNGNWLWVNVQELYLKHSELHDRLHFQDNLFVDIHPEIIVNHSAAKLRQMWSEILTMFKRAILQSRKSTNNGNVQANFSFSQSFFEFCWGRLDLLYLHKGLVMKPDLLDIVMEEKVRNESVCDAADLRKGLNAKTELSGGQYRNENKNLQMSSTCSVAKQSVTQKSISRSYPMHRQIQNNETIVQTCPFDSQITRQVSQMEKKTNLREHAGGSSNNMQRRAQQSGKVQSAQNKHATPHTYQRNAPSFPISQVAGHDFSNATEFARHQMHNKENLVPAPPSKRSISQIASQIQEKGTLRERKAERFNTIQREAPEAEMSQEGRLGQLTSQREQINARNSLVTQEAGHTFSDSTGCDAQKLNTNVLSTPLKRQKAEKVPQIQEQDATRVCEVNRSDHRHRMDHKTGTFDQIHHDQRESNHDQKSDPGKVESTEYSALPRQLNDGSSTSIGVESMDATLVTSSRGSISQGIDKHEGPSNALDCQKAELEDNDDQADNPTLSTSNMAINSDQTEKYAIIEQLSGSSVDTMSLSTLLVEGSENNSDHDTQSTQMQEAQMAAQTKEYTFIAPDNTHKDDPICLTKSKCDNIAGTELDLVRPSKRMHATRAVCTTTTTHSSVMATTDRWDLLEERLRRINQSIDRCHEGLSSTSKLQECHRRDLEADLAFYTAIKRQLQQDLVMSMHSFDSNSYMTTSHTF